MIRATTRGSKAKAGAARLPRVGISLGDPCGIGPEVTVGALKLAAVKKVLVPVVFGDAAVLEAAGQSLRGWQRATPDTLASAALDPTKPVLCTVTELSARDRKAGKPNEEAGRAQLRFVDAAIQAARHGHVEAVCTAPVSKEWITRAGIPFMGHTERFAEAFGRDVLMLMDGPLVRVALATNHLPIAQVPAALSVGKITEALELLSRSLRPVVKRTPRLAVLGLNPHAGEGGLLGREEVEVIGPAIEEAKLRGVKCEGPFPADGLFAKVGKLPYDGVLAMFHDQGLVATKALDFERTVNVTLGLPVPRTSPDHGVAYDIAGKGIASVVPMREALLKAAALVPKPTRR